MPAYFFDTSAVVKRYVSEVGTAWVKGIFDPNAGSVIYMARITGAEVLSALTRRQRRGDISPSDASAAIALFRSEFARAYELIEITPAVIVRAMDLAEKRGLRGYDAVQLATVLEINPLRPSLRLPALPLICADAELNAAATAEGRTVDDPNAHP